MRGTRITDTPGHTIAAGVSAVSWGAIIAGTAVAAATSLLLFALAVGLDLASLSSWPRRGLSATYVTTLTAITLIVTQWIAAALGGYIAGRLRMSWAGTHTHEVFFRDTAHGFITWCVATVLLASGVFSPVPSSPGAALRTDAVAAPQMVRPPTTVLRQTAAFSVPAGVPVAAGLPAAAGLPVAALPATAGLPVAAGLPAAALTEAGLSAHELFAQPVVVAQLTNAADAREAATSSVLTALSMLIGAFIASVSAALGGRLRDLHP